MKHVLMRNGWAMGIAAALAAGMLVGCERDRNDRDRNGEGNEEEQTLSAFQRILPSGLAMGPKSYFVPLHRYPVRCDAIPGAVRYHFTTSFGEVAVSATPEARFERRSNDDPFTLSVFATNAAGERTRTASRVVNTSDIVDASGRDPHGSKPMTARAKGDAAVSLVCSTT